MYNERNTQYNSPSERQGVRDRSEYSERSGNPSYSERSNGCGCSRAGASYQSRSSRSSRNACNKMSQNASPYGTAEALERYRYSRADGDRGMADCGCGMGDGGHGMTDCGCESKWGLRNRPLAMAYSPYQSWQNVYKEDTALSRGTMFAELDLPFAGSRCDK